MEAKELMIGDWVCFDGDKDYSYPVKIDGLTVSKEGVDAGVDGDWYSQWQPIPLTEEILEVNGFLDYGEIKEYQFKEDGEELRFYLKKMYNKDNVQDAWGTNIGGVLPSVIMYVHELQHALRLCGLNELSDNFKIE